MVDKEDLHILPLAIIIRWCQMKHKKQAPTPMVPIKDKLEGDRNKALLFREQKEQKDEYLA